MVSLRRVVAACALAMPLALGTSGLALADTYEAYEASAGPDGASLDVFEASTGHHHGGFHHHDEATFAEYHSTAGPDGASVEWLYLVVDEDGEFTYVEGADTAGPEGASSTIMAATGLHG